MESGSARQGGAMWRAAIWTRIENVMNDFEQVLHEIVALQTVLNQKTNINTRETFAEVWAE